LNVAGAVAVVLTLAVMLFFVLPVIEQRIDRDEVGVARRPSRRH
jgi:hypothetical protein